MSIVLRDVVLPLAHFDLAVSVEMGAPATAIYGPSGAGKTSLLEVIAGLRTPVAGQVTIDGRDVFDAARRLSVPPRLRRIGYVPQDDSLFPHLSVRRNLEFGARRGAESVVEILELGHLLDRGVRRLSGGERKRVALGRALLTDPEVLLLDEPMSGIDAPLRGRILESLLRIRDEFRVPILYVTHQRDEAEALCGDVVELAEGRVVGQSTERRAQSSEQREG